jgi:hypothetical protein
VPQGVPGADFPKTQCDFSKYFGPNYVVINLNFCVYPL